MMQNTVHNFIICIIIHPITKIINCNIIRVITEYVISCKKSNRIIQPMKDLFSNSALFRQVKKKQKKTEKCISQKCMTHCMHVVFFFFVKKEVENFGQNLASCSKTVFF